MRHKFFMIANAAAGLRGSPLVDQVSEALQRAGASVVCIRPADVKAVREAAREAASSGHYEAIIAAGGDGTIRHVATGLLGTRVPLGIVPGGTGNVLAHEIGLPIKPAAIADMLLRGTASTIMCASANDEPFLLMAGAGFDGRVIAALDHRLKSYAGKAAYAEPLLGTLIRPVDTLAVTIDGRHHAASWAVIANARHYGGRFVLAPQTSIQQRGLQAVLFKAGNRLVLMRQLLSLVTGNLDERAMRCGDVEMLPCASATITAHHPVPIQVDGDAFGSTPVHIEAGSAELELILPDPAFRTAGAAL